MCIYIYTERERHVLHVSYHIPQQNWMSKCRGNATYDFAPGLWLASKESIRRRSYGIFFLLLGIKIGNSWLDSAQEFDRMIQAATDMMHWYYIEVLLQLWYTVICMDTYGWVTLKTENSVHPVDANHGFPGGAVLPFSRDEILRCRNWVSPTLKTLRSHWADKIIETYRNWLAPSICPRQIWNPMFFWNRQPVKPLRQWFCRGAPVSSSIISNQLQRGLWLGDVSMDGSCIRACKTSWFQDEAILDPAFIFQRCVTFNHWSMTVNPTECHPQHLTTSAKIILPIAGWIIQQLLRQSLHFAAWARWGVRKHSISHQFSSHL